MKIIEDDARSLGDLPQGRAGNHRKYSRTVYSRLLILYKMGAGLGRGASGGGTAQLLDETQIFATCEC